MKVKSNYLFFKKLILSFYIPVQITKILCSHEKIYGIYCDLYEYFTFKKSLSNVT